ncbi:MAG: DNA polymerase III subunit gamma/tau [Anaerolineae bacterium]|jgi:DNA polymerase-3 subunit gamma/tau|nr:DNA polymerase III subunit gamma/tau [Anaerolineae bacterium]MDH7473061.1 DNA polymerase III subunit gamma/tau [Anaerolineae bacterium]
MVSQALYRKWRPKTFEEMVGQEHVTRTLRNALRDGRIAHAYLFAGPRGTGKTTAARLLAKAVNCLADAELRPCNECAICVAINEGRLLDLIEIDAASNRGIDEIRDLREKVAFRPTEARYKVYVVDEVHMLTNEAFNALLKTLEEPPPHVIFVLATTEPHKIPATVLSRCQRFDFHRIPLSGILERLEHIAAAEGLTVEREALELIARSATGSLRDAESLLDQLGSSGDDKIEVDQVRAMLGVVPAQVVSRLVEHLISGEVAAGLEVINRSIDEGIDPRQLARQITEHLRALLVLRVGDGVELLDVPDDSLEEMRQQASRLSLKQMVRAIKLFNQASLDLRGSLQPQLTLELALVEATLGDSQSETMPPEPPPAAVRTRPPAAGTSPAIPIAPSGPGPSSINEPAETGQATPTVSESASQRVSEATAGGPITLEAVRLNWARILSEIRPLNRTAEALLRSCAPVRVEGDNVLVIGAEHNFHKERLEEPRCKQVLETVLSQILGYQCRVRCVITSKEQTVNSPNPSQADEVSRSESPVADQQQQKYQDMVNDPLIREAVQRYGAQVVDIQ